MQNEREVRDAVIEAITKITTHPVRENFEIILTGIDELDAPCGKVAVINSSKVFGGILIPEWIWSKLSKSGIQAVTAIELVNTLLMDKITTVEKRYQNLLAENDKKYSDQQSSTLRKQKEGELLAQLELDEKGSILQLSRKLSGDESVAEWLVKADFDTRGMIEVFQLLITASFERVIPTIRIPARIHGFIVRIQHVDHLINGRTKKAEVIRNLYDKLTERILSKQTPPT